VLLQVCKNFNPKTNKIKNKIALNNELRKKLNFLQIKTKATMKLIQNKIEKEMYRSDKACGIPPWLTLPSAPKRAEPNAKPAKDSQRNNSVLSNKVNLSEKNRF
jgi:hypothetical protein